MPPIAFETQPPSSPSSKWSRVTHSFMVMCLATLGLKLVNGASAQVPAVLSGGPPVQVVPYVSEPGVPSLTITPGTANPFAGADGSGSTGTGSSTSSGASTGGNVGDSDALSTMLGTSWGGTAVSNATALGVNPSALAATCVIESSTCNSSAQTGSYVGAFQMGQAAFQEGLQTALAAAPSLQSQIVQGAAGINDPTTEAIAASGYLMQATQALQSAGISDPTAVQARGYYNFGPSAGTAIATAPSTALMSQYISSNVMSANGVTPSETVGQWPASVAAIMGNAANQSVMASS